jgi:predicted Zn-dependent peptidase
MRQKRKYSVPKATSMKKIILTILTISVTGLSWAQTLDRSARPKPGPAPEIKLGKTESFTLANGMKVFVVENHKLPTIAASIQLDIKPELEGDMIGYREMMSELLTSGTKTRSNEQLNKEIDFIGANIDASDEGINASGLKKHQEKILELMADIAMNADFKQSELEKINTRTLSGLEAEENEPDAMLNKVSAVLNFGKQHPYGEVATKETVAKINLERARKYYSTYFRPNVAYMAIVGDVTVDEVKPLIEKYFGKWQKATVPVAKYSNPQAPATRKVAFVPRDAAVQSVINVTYPLDLKPGTPDVIKARVANSILGGGSNGRLFLNLREKHGWTYGSYSSINQDDLKGSFTAYAKGRNAVTDSSVGEIIAEMNKLRNQRVGKEELQNHIVNMSGAFAIGLENPGTVAQYAINIERYNMPKDYYKNYLKNLAAVTAEDVQATAKKYIDPNKAYLVVVGSKDEVPKTLVKYASNGKIEYYDTYGRTIEPVKTAAAPTGLTGDDVVKKYVAAVGGEKVISAIKDIKTVSTGEVQGIALTITEMKKAPNKLKFSMEGMGMVLQKKVYNGSTGYQEAQGQKANLEGDELEEAKEDADIYADLHPEQYGKKRILKGMEKVNGSDAYIVEETNAKGKKTTQYYDVKSGYLVKAVETADTPQGAMTTTQEYSDYMEVPGSGGYKIPNTVKIAAGPQVITVKVKTAEVNIGIADIEFQ